MYKLLVNPNAGTGLASELLSACPVGWQMMLMTPGETQQQVASLVRPGDILVLAGGDGSVHQVLNALHSLDLTESVRLALLPFGTGNDLARAAGLTKLHPFELLTYFMSLKSSLNTCKLPFWMFGDICFSNYVSCGYDADVLHQVDAKRSPDTIPKSTWALKHAYLRAALSSLQHLQRYRDMDFGTDTPQHDGAASLLISNLASYSGAHCLDQNSFAKALSIYSFSGATDLLKLACARSSLLPKLKPKSTTETFHLHLDEHTPLQIDGEAYPGQSGDIKLAGELELLFYSG